jgi:1,2-dihydroxy-3-keto-5-methylthiopentene dioxygenase
MAVLHIPDQGAVHKDFELIQRFLRAQGIDFQQIKPRFEIAPDAGQEEILSAYADFLQPYCATKGYGTTDVISASYKPGVDLNPMRQKFLSEHRHTEDEARLFVDGKGLFWINDGVQVFGITCFAGELLSVPANTRHWFEMGAKPNVKAVRFFTEISGWVPHYVAEEEEPVHEKYNRPYDQELIE